MDYYTVLSFSSVFIIDKDIFVNKNKRLLPLKSEIEVHKRNFMTNVIFHLNILQKKYT